MNSFQDAASTMVEAVGAGTLVEPEPQYMAYAVAVLFVIQMLKKKGTWWHRVAPAKYQWMIPVAMSVLPLFLESLIAGRSWKESLVKTITGAGYTGVAALGMFSAYDRTKNGDASSKSLRVPPVNE